MAESPLSAVHVADCSNLIHLGLVSCNVLAACVDSGCEHPSVSLLGSLWLVMHTHSAQGVNGCRRMY